MKPSRLSAAFAALLLAFTCLPAAAQDDAFIGVVKENNLDVRSGAGRAYYVVGVLAKGELVDVEKVRFNGTWYQVKVPAGIYSYVSKVFVDAKGDGETGTVNANDTEFKAASVRGPGESYRVQGTLDKGDTVTIIAEEGNYYKIQSPASAVVFIPADTLRKATKKEIEAAAKATKTPDKKTTEPDKKTTEPDKKTTEPDKKTTEPDKKTTEPDKKTAEPDKKTTEPDKKITEPDKKTTEPDKKTEPVKKTEPDKPLEFKTPAEEGWPPVPDVNVTTPAKSEELKALELKLRPYEVLPLSKQPLDKIGQAYQNLLDTGDLPKVDKQIIGVRLRQNASRKARLAVILSAKAASKSDAGTTKVPDKKADKPLPTQYAAVGLLQPSTTFDGNGTLPLMYRIVDPSTNFTKAYVAPHKNLNVASMLNNLIGVTGEIRYNPALKVNIITLDQAVLLEARTNKDKADDTEKDDAGSK